MTTNVDQTNFAAGELAPAVKGRADLKNYYQGAETCRNWWPMIEGGLKRRPGTRFISNFNGSAFQLEEFVFNDDQAYLFVFSASGFLTIYSMPDVTFVVEYNTGAWTSAMLKQLRCATRGDTMIVTHKDMVPQVITRTDATNFTIANFTFDHRPPVPAGLGALIVVFPARVMTRQVTITLPDGGTQQQTVPDDSFIRFL